MSAAPTIFIVEDDEAVRDSLRTLLLTQFQDVRDFASGHSFLADVEATTRGCLILDLNLPKMNGLDLMRRMAMAGYRLPTILITGQGDVMLDDRARKLGAIALLDKPVEYAALVLALDRALSGIGRST